MTRTSRFKLPRRSAQATHGGWLVTALLALSLHAGPGWAGVQAAGNDATLPRSCLAEGWFSDAGGERGITLAPACGMAESLEPGADYTLPGLHHTARDTTGLAVQWAPASWRLTTAAGVLGFGLKATAMAERAVGSGWRRVGEGALALASLQVAEGWSVHGNLGLQRDRATTTRATLYSVAVAWEPSDHTLVYAGALGNNRPAGFGGKLTGIGGRYWVLKQRVGVDLTASREAGAAPTIWSLDVGWYGMGF